MAGAEELIGRRDTSAATTASRSPADSPAVPLALANLLNDFEELACLLRDQLAAESLLDAFLLAAGMNQIVEDYLGDPYSLGKVARRARGLQAPLGSVAAATLRIAGAVVSRMRAGGRADLERWQLRLAAFVEELAVAAVDSDGVTPSRSAELRSSAELLLAPVAAFPRSLRREVIRLPSCFRAFDQHPADIGRLVSDVSLRWSDTRRPIAIVGVRTSGSYLAPLCCAFLRHRGYERVEVITVRPGQLLWHKERRALLRTVSAGGLVLVTDDPPNSGGALGNVLAGIERSGVPRDAIVLLLQLLAGSDRLPPVLAKYASVVLPWPEWAIHQRLRPEAVTALLRDLWDGAHVEVVEQLRPPEAQSVRSHARALYSVRITGPGGPAIRDLQVFVKGVGLGYFGQHSLAVAGALRGLVATVYGLRDGLLYREWLPDDRRLRGNEANWTEIAARDIASYVVSRARALPLAADICVRLVGRGVPWHTAGLLSRAFGRAAGFALPLTYVAARRLLRTGTAAVTDGSTAPTKWFRRDDGCLTKTDFDDSGFNHYELFCSDPAFDLAGTAALSESHDLLERLRPAYRAVAGEEIDEERWLIYQLLHLQRALWESPSGSLDLRRAMSNTLQRYFANVFFADVVTPSSGRLFAVDVDGVLESGELGFSGTTASGALALRALAKHGIRVVLATGRSLPELIERCDHYALAGGVGEYGAVIYDHKSGVTKRLLSDSDREDLGRLRGALGGLAEVHLDPAYGESVRAFRFDASGRRRGLDERTIKEAMRRSMTAERLKPIAGEGQTDFVPASINKAVALRILAEDFGADASARPFAYAIGDTVSDLAMLELAKTAFAPRNVAAALRRPGVRIMTRPCTEGFAQAAAVILGHRPTGCGTCRAADLSASRRLLLTMLGAQGGGMRGKVGAGLRLALALVSG